MRSIGADGVAWSASRSVCLSVTIVSNTKITEMLFGMWTVMDPKNHV